MFEYQKYIIPHDRRIQVNVEGRIINQIKHKDSLYLCYLLDSIDIIPQSHPNNMDDVTTNSSTHV